MRRGPPDFCPNPPVSIGYCSAAFAVAPSHCRLPGGQNVRHRNIAALAAIGLSLAACAGTPDGPGPRENSGTLMGAGSGALLGAAVAGGGTGNRLAGGVIGGLLGA